MNDRFPVIISRLCEVPPCWSLEASSAGNESSAKSEILGGAVVPPGHDARTAGQPAGPKKIENIFLFCLN